jgi:hypothetical protein
MKMAEEIEQEKKQEAIKKIDTESLSLEERWNKDPFGKGIIILPPESQNEEKT